MKCSLCGANMTEGKIKHIVDLGKQTIIVKDVPALVCHQCGASFLDDEENKKIKELKNELLK